MVRLTRSLLAIALLTCASFAHADALRLLAPANGATLRGGSFAEVRWSAAELPPTAEEWEAFLSIDGGKYYAFRITPHLDLDLQRFTFVVPNVATDNARILIRVGNEVRETHFETRAKFSILHDAEAELAVSRLLHFGRGEAAREGDPAVVAWADGARNGSRVTQQVSAHVPSRTLGRRAAAVKDAAPVLSPAANALESSPTATVRRSSRTAHVRSAEPPALSVDLLLVCRRRNI